MVIGSNCPSSGFSHPHGYYLHYENKASVLLQFESHQLARTLHLAHPKGGSV